MAIATVSAVDKALKVRYPDRKVKFVGYQGNPLLALLPKNEKFTGKQYSIAIWYGGNQGASRDFATAKANKTAGLYKNFDVTRVSDYGLTSISNEAILASQGDDAAFLNLAVGEVDNTVRTVARNYAISLYRNSGGARGQIAAGGVTATTLTLADPTQVVNFEVGMRLKQSTTDGTSGSVGGAAAIEILSIDRRLGVLTFAATTGFTALDYLFREGDFGVAMAGLDSWIPFTTPSGSDSFFGVNRSTDTRLYGMAHDGSAQTIEEAIQDLDGKLFSEGAQPDHCFMNPKDVNSLRKSLGSAVVRDIVKSPDMTTVSFETVKLMGMAGPISVVADRNCPAGRGYVLQLNTFEALSLGGAPRVLENMGQKYIWDNTTDSIEARVGYYGNLGCHAPGYNGVVKFY